MSDPFDASAYQGVVNTLVADVHVQQHWVRELKRRRWHADVPDAYRKLQGMADPLVEKVADFIERHLQYAIRELRTLGNPDTPNPFDDARLAVLEGAGRAMSLPPAINDGLALPVGPAILQRFREAKATYDLEVERVRKALADGPWSKPDSPKRWAGQFGISDRTFKRRVEDGTIRAKVLSDRLYQIHLGDLPLERPASTSGHK
jgi:hypothetical protein